MIISKKFNDFKSIINNVEKRKLLFRGSNLWQRYQLWIYSNKKVVVEDDKIMIPFYSGGKHHYNAVFIRNIETGEVLIENSKIGSNWWFFLNKLICKRIEKNWEKCWDDK